MAQVQQATIGVVAKFDSVAEGVNPLDLTTTAVVTQAGDALGWVGIGGQLADGVDVVAVDAPIGALAFYQVAAGVIPIVGMLATVLRFFFKALGPGHGNRSQTQFFVTNRYLGFWFWISQYLAP